MSYTTVHKREALAELGDKVNVPARKPKPRKDSKELSDEPINKPAEDANTGKKRGLTEEPQDFDDSDWREAFDGQIIDKNCDQVRRMIRRLIENGGMKIGEFCDKIGVSNRSYNTFMGQNGPMKGSATATFSNAAAYFKYREMKGIPLPKAGGGNKKQKTTASGAKGVSKSAPKDKSTPTAADLADTHLPAEEKDAVGVYDTCDEIRRKINAHMKKPGVTQAQFCRDVAAMYTNPTKITASQLTAFRGKKGPNAGNTSNVFYGAYCFFEKLRLKEGKPKSKHREDMEGVWGRNSGFDTSTRHDHGYWCRPSDTIDEDKYGKISINGRTI